ncbi:MAG: hypothetical protein KDC34_07640 [Saprospiraceae bacterium]|nr:hypothetical protein [Saprospiraceae bacterium]
MRITILSIICLFASQAFAQMPLRNYIGETEKNITASLDELGLYYELQYDTEYEYWDGIQMIMIWKDEESAYIGNSAWVYLSMDKCYQVQYNFFNDELVLESIRGVLERRSDFYPCSDMSDCWSQEIENRQTSYYWNLFTSYEGDEGWKAVIIEDQEKFEENRYMYEWSKY